MQDVFILTYFEIKLNCILYVPKARTFEKSHALKEMQGYGTETITVAS